MNFLAVQEAFSRHGNTFSEALWGKNEIKYHKKKIAETGALYDSESIVKYRKTRCHFKGRA